jgi:branched-chain amino acid transport system permease protein
MSSSARRSLLLGLVALAVLAAIAPLLISNPYASRLAQLLFLNVLLASAWNLVGGFAGQISFGNASLFGVGAYATSMLWLAGFHPFLTMPVAAFLAAVYGVLWGWPCLRLRGPYFAIATIGVAEATRIVANHVEAAGGASGLTLPLEEDLGPVLLYAVGAVLAVSAVLVSIAVRRSRLGLGLIALREDARAAAASGVNVARQQVTVFAVAAALTGLAGGYYALFTLYVVPEKVFGFDLSISLVLMVLVGGIGTVLGPVLGAGIYLFLEQFVLASLADIHLAAFGALLIFIILLEPRGAAPRLVQLVRLIRRRLG